MTTTNPMTVNQAELARILGISPRHVRRLENDGMADARVSDSGREAAYDLPSAVQWWVEARAPEDDELREARIRKTRADAELREDRVRQERRDLIPADEVLDKIRKPLEAVDAKLRAAPRIHARALAEAAGITQGKAIHLLQDAVEGIRADLRSVFEGDT